MITAIVHHWVVPEKLDTAKNLIQQTGKVMRSFPGFVSRQTLIAQANPLQISTVTCWETEQAYQGWLKERAKRPAPPGGLWSKEPETTIFTSIPEIP